LFHTVLTCKNSVFISEKALSYEKNEPWALVFPLFARFPSPKLPFPYGDERHKVSPKTAAGKSENMT
jgi:hypothetical protein